MMKTNYYILISSDSPRFDGKVISGENICAQRLEKGLWPLYRGTKYKDRIISGDKCLFYIAGIKSYSQHLIGSALITGNHSWIKKTGLIDSEDLLTDFPDRYLTLETTNEMGSPVYIKSLLNELDFLPTNKSAWGAGMQGGVKKISQQDYELIIAHSAK